MKLFFHTFIIIYDVHASVHDVLTYNTLSNMTHRRVQKKTSTIRAYPVRTLEADCFSTSACFPFPFPFNIMDDIQLQQRRAETRAYGYVAMVTVKVPYISVELWTSMFLMVSPAPYLSLRRRRVALSSGGSACLQFHVYACLRRLGFGDTHRTKYT